MPTNYTPNASNNPGSITLPSDADGATAESVNAALRALGDKAAYAIATSAAFAAFNTFTRGQAINPPTETEGVLYSDRFPGQIVADNRWTLIFKFKIESNRSVRLYTGAVQGIGRWAWTQNAHWNVDNQQWELEDEDQTAAAMLWIAAAFTMHYVPAHTAPFQNWPTSSQSQGHIKTVGEFQYASSKNRIRTIPLATCAGNYTINAGNGSVGAAVLGSSDHIRWPIRLPPGAVITKINVMHYLNSSAVETFRLVRRRPTWDPGSLTTPSEPYLATADSDSSTGMHITTITTSQAVDKYDDLSLVWVPSAAILNDVHGITIEWSDPGPSPI